MNVFWCPALILGSIANLSAAARSESTYVGLSGATVLNSGIMEITGAAPFAREELFEYIRRPDGGVTLLNIMTANDGSYRVRVRYDMDDAWNYLSASGAGLYEGVPVDIKMKPVDKLVQTTVRGEGVDLNPTSICDPDCFLNMSPSALSMFVMTRHYSHVQGGTQTFQWAGQDLDRVRTLSGGEADLTYQGERSLQRAALPGQTPPQVTVRHYTFVEKLPIPDGGIFTLDFDLWTDAEEWPLGFRVTTPGGATIGFLKGWEDLRDQLLN